jgi:lipoprotein-anchoring transpeptidase ErfK/SrfK
VSLPKPTYTPAAPSNQMAVLQATATPASLPTDLPSIAPTDVPTDQPVATAADLPADTSIPTAAPIWSGSLSLSYVQDTPTSADTTSADATSAPAVANAPSLPPVPGDAPGNGVHWIDVDLTHQMVYAYSGNTVVNSFLVSTGTWDHPTVTGKYHIYVKLRYTDMSGPDYYLPNVPFTMYFYEGYGLHGTYWHHNFGTPMSHGCVNLATPDAEWLYGFSSVGTLVNVHY